MYSSTRRDHHLYKFGYKFGCGFYDPAKIQNSQDRIIAVIYQQIF